MKKVLFTVFSLSVFVFLYISCGQYVLPKQNTEQTELPIGFDNNDDQDEDIDIDNDIDIEEFDPVGLLNYLNSHENGVSVDDPVILKINIDLGNMPMEGSGWKQLLAVIELADKYVCLDLSNCKMYGNVFEPDLKTAEGKNKIVSLVLPSAAKSIPDALSGFMWIWEAPIVNPFKHFNVLTEINGLNITYIGYKAFDRLAALESANFPKANYIGEEAFSGCTSLAYVNFPSVTNIGTSAFAYCSELNSVVFPIASSTGIYAFRFCTSLTNVSFPKAYNIDAYSFESCTSLINADFPKAVSIGKSAFSGCSSLTSINFPSAASIGGTVFAGGLFTENTSLTSISFPASANIDDNAFSCHSALISFILTGSGSLSTIEDGRALVRNKTELVSYPSASGSIHLTGITSISNNAFERCHDVVNVSFPDVTSIGNNAFLICTGLISADFPKVINIGYGAFLWCTLLSEVNIPRIETIGITSTGTFFEGAFSYCPALSIVTMGILPPKLLVSSKHVDFGAFRGTTTPDNFIIRRPAESSQIYLDWIKDNESHFSSNGVNIQFEDYP